MDICLLMPSLRLRNLNNKDLKIQHNLEPILSFHAQSNTKSYMYGIFL